MKTVFFSLFLSIVFINKAQSNLTIFNNGDQAFHIIINGIKQNQFPQKNVCVTNISNGGHALKVVFANGASADIDKKLYLTEASDIRMGIEFKKGIGKLKIISYVPSEGTQTSGVVFRPNDNAIYSDAPVVQNQNQSNSTVNQNTTQTISNQVSPQNSSSNTTNSTTTTTTVTTTGNGTNPANNTTGINGGVNISMDLNGMNMNVTDPVTGQNLNMNINVNGTNGSNMNSTSTSTTSQTTTTTISTSSQNTTSSNNSNNTAINTTGNGFQPSSTVNSTTQTNTISGVVTTTNSQPTSTVIRGLAKINCAKSIGNIDSYIKDLKALSFESDQVEAIEKDLISTCLTSTQAYKIVEILTFESNRLDIAKFLSDRMTNRDKASELLPLFTFDSNKVEYKEYIR
jgi:hypothetical protein